MTFGINEITLRNESGRIVKISPEDMFLILKGRAHLQTDKEGLKTRMKFNLPMILLTGGFPVWSKVEEKTKDTTTEVQHFIRLYDRTFSEPRGEIFENHFDFSVLGSNIAPSSLTNLNTIVANIRKVFPGAIFDEKLVKSSGANVEDLELNCRLIYLSYRGSKQL
jgi:hypothetical protein